MLIIVIFFPLKLFKLFVHQFDTQHAFKAISSVYDITKQKGETDRKGESKSNVEER